MSRHGVRRVCVTGALGFIGTHLSRALVQRGYEVRCVDRLSGRYASTAGASWFELGRLPGVELVRADVATCPPGAILDGVDASIHLAALPGVRERHDLNTLWSDNVLATTRLLRETERRGARFVLASTSSVYGNAALLPTPEDSPPAPLNPYALSKLAAEQACRSAASAGADAVVARLFTVYGPGQRPDMAFARWIDALIAARPLLWCADPLAARDFTFVEDAVAGLIAALERGSAGEAYNVAGTGPRPLREALSLLERMLGRAGVVEHRSSSPAEAVVTAACGERALGHLGYRARVGLEEGLARQVAEVGSAPSHAIALQRGRAPSRSARGSSSLTRALSPAPSGRAASRVGDRARTRAGRRVLAAPA